MISNCPGMDQWHKGVAHSVRSPTFAGTILLIVWVFGFGLWATMAPLNGAVIASGAFVATGQNKHVQHLEGGIVRDILVTEGDIVERGQTLMRLDDTAAKARLRRLVIRAQRLSAMKVRVEAEVQERDTLLFSEAIKKTAESDPELAEIIERQQTEFKARRSKMSDEVEVLQKEIAGLVDSMAGYQAQIDATNEQIANVGEELKDKQQLLLNNLIRKTEVLAIQRSGSRMNGDLGQLLGRIGDTRERIARANQQIAQIHSTIVQRATEELRSTETELDDVNEQIRAAQDILSRIEITAPVRGAVVKLNQHTPGGVVQPGAVILELLPVNDELIIETRILASDIAHVKEGQTALVRLNALNQRIVPMVTAHVQYVSADAVTDIDPRKSASAPMNQSNFIVRVKLDQQDLKAKAGSFEPTPGMPADVYIQTGEPTFFQYLLKPIIDSFSRAFREA